MAGQSYYVKRRKRVIGPFTAEKITAALKSGKMAKSDLISTSKDRGFVAYERVAKRFGSGGWSSRAYGEDSKPKGEWFLKIKQVEAGPFTAQQIDRMRESGNLNKDSLVMSPELVLYRPFSWSIEVLENSLVSDSVGAAQEVAEADERALSDAIDSMLHDDGDEQVSGDADSSKFATAGFWLRLSFQITAATFVVGCGCVVVPFVRRVVDTFRYMSAVDWESADEITPEDVERFPGVDQEVGEFFWRHIEWFFPFAWFAGFVAVGSWLVGKWFESKDELSTNASPFRLATKFASSVVTSSTLWLFVTPLGVVFLTSWGWTNHWVATIRVIFSLIVLIGLPLLLAAIAQANGAKGQSVREWAQLGFFGGLGVIMVFGLGWYIGGGTHPSSNPGVASDHAIMVTGRGRLKGRLKDPSSLEIISERVVKPGRNGSRVGYAARYRAKNSFGGYTVDEFYTE